jgi:hypothetical protein
MMHATLFVIIGLIFGLLAALMAFGIVECERHKFLGWQLWQEPLRRAMFTLAFFLMLSIALGFALPAIIK